MINQYLHDFSSTHASGDKKWFIYLRHCPAILVIVSIIPTTIWICTHTKE